MTSLAVEPNGQALLADYPPGAVFGPRTLHSCEFIWLVDGSAAWDWQRAGQQDEVTLRPGMLALATPGMRDRLRWDLGRPSRHAYVHFTVSADQHRPDYGHWPTIRDLTRHPVLAGLCDYLIDLGSLGDAAATTRSTEVITLLLSIFLSGPFRSADTDLDPYLRAVVDHVREAWSAGMRIVSVDELCTATGLSAGHLHRRFRQRFGCGPARALELVRLAQAALVLQRSNLSLAQVAARTGYPNPYHFSRRFSASYGLPPGEFRRRGEQLDPFGPVRDAALLPVAHRLLGTA